MIGGALALTAWGGVGLYQGLHSGFSGGLYDPEYRVPGVMPGGLADRSGFQAGDRVISVEGRPVEELGMESRWPRSLATRIGESRRFVVERAGQRVSLDVVYPPPSAEATRNRLVAAAVGLGFLGFGYWAFLTVGTRDARTLAYIGLAAGVSASLGLGPNLGSWNGLQHHFATAGNVLMFILLLRFFVEFPAPKRVSESRLAAWLVYGVWACFGAFLLIELAVHPALYYTTGSVAGPLILAYSVLILAAIAHTLVRGPRSGMYWILGALLVAVAGPASAAALGVSLPGWAYAALILTIPFTMALAVRRRVQIAAAAAGSSRAS